MSYLKILKKVETLEKALNCKICSQILVDPLLLVNCGHSICKQCFVEQLSKTCPVCNAPVKTRGSLEDKQLKDLLLHLKELKSVLQNETESGLPVDPSTNESVGDEKSDTNRQEIGPICSTPKIPKRKSLVEISSTLLSSCEDSIVQETPENRVIKTPAPANQKRKSLNKKLSTSTSSPNTSTQSPISNLNKKNHKGETLLHSAVIKGDITKVTDYLREGALVNTQDNNGWTPLHEASNHGFVEIAKLLLDHGALVNVPSTHDNITPLHDCLLNDQIPMAILLVSRGADVHAKTSFGYTALDLCKRNEDRRTLTEACSPFIDANTLVPYCKVSAKQPGKLVFLSTNLNDIQKQQLQKCAQMLKADVVESFMPEVTHVVTSCDKMGNCVRTMKTLLGILSGKWIMNHQWIEVCLEYKKKVEEEVFEVQGTKNQPNTQGPKRGRQNCEQKFPPLFDGFFFYLHGTFNKPTPEREVICNLVHLGGGKILSREPRPDTVTTDGFLIPYHAAGTALEDTSHVILFQDKPPRDLHVRSGHIATTQVMWLIACISEFKLLELKQTSPTNK